MDILVYSFFCFFIFHFHLHFHFSFFLFFHFISFHFIYKAVADAAPAVEDLAKWAAIYF